MAVETKKDKNREAGRGNGQNKKHGYVDAPKGTRNGEVKDQKPGEVESRLKSRRQA